MAETPDFTEIMRRAVQLNATLYKGWVDLSVQYMRGLAEIFGTEIPPAGGAQDVEHDDIGVGAGAVVLEADDGDVAGGAFLVTNDLGRILKCQMVASDFTDRTGGRAPARVAFEPPSFELAPGEQQVVQVSVPIDAKLDAGVAYSGEFSLEGLDGFTVPVVLRRTHRIEKPLAERDVEPPRPMSMAADAAAQQPAAKRKAAAKKTTRAARKSPKRKS